MFFNKIRKYYIICIIFGFLFFRNALANSTSIEIVDSIALPNITTISMPHENTSNKAQNGIDQLPIELTTFLMDSTVFPMSPLFSSTAHKDILSNMTEAVPSHSEDIAFRFSNSSTLSVIPLVKSKATVSQNINKENMSSSGNEVYIKEKSDKTMPIVVFDHLAETNGIDSSFPQKEDKTILNYGTEISMTENENSDIISVTSDSEKHELTSTPSIKHLENPEKNHENNQTESNYEDNQIVKTNRTTAFPKKEGKLIDQGSAVIDTYTKEFSAVTLSNSPALATSSYEQESTEITPKNSLNSLQYEGPTSSDLPKARSMNSFAQQPDNGKIDKQITYRKSILNEFHPSIKGSDFNPIDIKNTSLQFVTARKLDELQQNEPTRSNISMDLSDVTMNNDDEDDFNSQIEHPENEHLQIEDTNNNYDDSQETHELILTTDTSASVVSEPDCLEGGRVFKSGETLQRDCNETCTCNRGEWFCKSRCDVLLNQHQNIEGANCHEIGSEDDECCARMECASNTTTNSISFNDSNGLTPVLPMIPHECQFNGAVYKFRERLEIGCDQICHCDSGGKMNCRARCDQQNHTRLEKCVLIKDPKDVCCQLELCDVTLDDHEQTSSHATSFISNNNLTMHTNDYQEPDNTCLFKNTTYKIGDQIHDDCNALCLCTKEGLHCVKLECPSNFGLDVLDPYCLHWETEPKAFRAIAPKCCPERMRCVNNGTCEYKDQQFDNWSAIPTNLTGCEKHCYCENGKVECSAACPPVLALPPNDLPCHHSLVRLEPLPEDECCKHWACPATPEIVPLDSANDFTENNIQSKLEVIILEAIDAHSVRIVFTVPQVYVNLHGRVEIRYTKTNNNDTSTWETQMFAPPEDLIATSQLEFELPNLEPNSLYNIKITLILRDLNFQPSSQIYNVKTLDERTITPPSSIAVYKSDIIAMLKNFKGSEMSIGNTSSTSLQLTWNKLSEEMVEFIDGIILKYKKLTESSYTASPLLHRTLTRYNITDLQPDTSYEIDLYYIPVQGHGEEVKVGNTITAHTVPNVDDFAFNVSVNVTKVTSALVEFSWSGIPYPEDKYVNIYRAKIHSEFGSEDSSVFKVLKRNSNSDELISDLNPGTKYTLWLEMYLTNGNVRKSNVVSFTTLPGYSTTPSSKGKLNTANIEAVSENDYYGALVVVSLVAAVAVMAIFILLLLLTRRRGHQTASINPPRKSDAAFDNPSYKVDVQQETMNL